MKISLDGGKRSVLYLVRLVFPHLAHDRIRTLMLTVLSQKEKIYVTTRCYRAERATLPKPAAAFGERKWAAYLFLLCLRSTSKVCGLRSY